MSGIAFERMQPVVSSVCFVCRLFYQSTTATCRVGAIVVALQLSKQRTLIICIPLLLLIVMLLFVPYQTALVFYKAATHHIEAYLPVESGDRFQMIYKHSIHLTDVVEKYTVLDNQTIKQYDTVFEHYDIGKTEDSQGEEYSAYDIVCEYG